MIVYKIDKSGRFSKYKEILIRVNHINYGPHLINTVNGFKSAFAAAIKINLLCLYIYNFD